ncbi:MAG: hypothetical protein KA194_06425, partial [Alcaligenes sp.]|nr:hypothetical protein [Alcaligenes sp.]
LALYRCGALLIDLNGHNTELGAFHRLTGGNKIQHHPTDRVNFTVKSEVLRSKAQGGAEKSINHTLS